jgi:hypothetical protein
MSSESSETVSIWREPIPMETGSPNPIVVRDGQTAWVAYLARDPEFPGWEDSSVTGDLERHPGEPFGVLRFDGVVELAIGPPSDERLHEHPLYVRGLEFYSFHRIHPSKGGCGRWIVTFHDETLDVRASAASAFPLRFATTAKEAIASAKQAG